MLKQTNLVKPNIHGAHQKAPQRALCEPRPAAGKEVGTDALMAWNGTGHPLPTIGHWLFIQVTGSDHKAGPGGQDSAHSREGQRPLSPLQPAPMGLAGQVTVGARGQRHWRVSEFPLGETAKFPRHFLSKSIQTQGQDRARSATACFGPHSTTDSTGLTGFPPTLNYKTPRIMELELPTQGPIARAKAQSLVLGPQKNTQSPFQKVPVPGQFHKLGHQDLQGQGAPCC